MKTIIDQDFDKLNDTQLEANCVFQIFPNIFNDDRGYFTEVLKAHTNDKILSEIPLWISSLTWIKQINRSSSSKYTIRGCHAQKAPYCQGKLVEALNETIYDIITDARPESTTCGLTKIYILNPKKQNKLWVPPGFLHAFIVPECEGNAVFQYFCSNVYNKESEIGVNPLTILPIAAKKYKQDAEDYNILNRDDYINIYNILNDENVSISDKDKNGLDYVKWMEEIKNEYEKTGKSWWR